MRNVFALCLQAIAPKLRRPNCGVSLPTIGAKEPAASLGLSGTSNRTPKVPTIGASFPGGAGPDRSGVSKPGPSAPNIGASSPRAAADRSTASKPEPPAPNIGTKEAPTAASVANDVTWIFYDNASFAGEAEHQRYNELLFPSRSVRRGEELDQSVLNDDSKQNNFAFDLMKLGTMRGKGYASLFVARFVVWFSDTARLTGEWHVEAIVSLAFQAFCVEVGLEMPVVRNFLWALKRHPGVEVFANRRIYDDEGHCMGKGTFYLLPANVGVKEAI